MKIQLNWEQILVNSAGLRGARTTFWQPSPGEWLPAPAPGAAGWGSPLVIPQWNFSWTVAAPEWEQGESAAHVAPWRQSKVCRVREMVGSCSGCLHLCPGCAMWCLSALEKVPSFLPDCLFPDEMIWALVVPKV